MKKRSTLFKDYFLQDMSPVIRFLILSDTVFMGAAGMLGPIFALFVEGFVKNGNAAVAGIAACIYLVTKSVLQVPVAQLIDRIRGEKDDYWIMFISTVLVAFVPLLYLVVKTPVELYVVQFVLGFGTAFTFPTYMALFTRHIDRAREGTEWGVYYMLTDLTGATLAAIGGYVAEAQGFPTLITVVVIVGFLGALLLWPIRKYIRVRT